MAAKLWALWNNYLRKLDLQAKIKCVWCSLQVEICQPNSTGSSLSLWQKEKLFFSLLFKLKIILIPVVWTCYWHATDWICRIFPILVQLIIFDWNNCLIFVVLLLISLSVPPFCALIVEPSFVFADVIREGKNRAAGEDDKIYYFFTEVSVEYEFFGKLLIPRVARVCKVSTYCAPSAHTSNSHLYSPTSCCSYVWDAYLYLQKKKKSDCCFRLNICRYSLTCKVRQHLTRL